MPSHDPDPPRSLHADAEWFERPTGRHLSAWLDRTTHSRHVAAGEAGAVLWELRLRRGGDVEVTIAVPSSGTARAGADRVPGVVWGESARSAGWWSGLHLVQARWPAPVACDLERCAARAERWAMTAAGRVDGSARAEVCDVG